MYSYLYALIQKSEFGPIIAQVKPRREMLVTYNREIHSDHLDRDHRTSSKGVPQGGVLSPLL